MSTLTCFSASHAKSILAIQQCKRQHVLHKQKYTIQNLRWSPTPRICTGLFSGDVTCRGHGSQGSPVASRRLCTAASKRDDTETDLNKEIALIALPTLAALAADPVAALIDTAWVGRVGTNELAAVGLALSVFGTISKLLNVPLLAVTTSTVAVAVGKGGNEREIGGAAAAALSLALLAGAAQAVLLLLMGGAGLSLWGAAPGSALYQGAQDFLQIRTLGAPAAVGRLVLQGVFRGLGDTQTPLIATLGSATLLVLLDPIFIFTFGLGIKGAALATVISEVVCDMWMLRVLSRRCHVSLQGSGVMTNALEFLRPTGLLILRTAGIAGVMALATSLSTRIDAVHAASHQVCLQVWLASSLLADSLAVAAQSLVARNLAANNATSARGVVSQVLRLSLILGATLGAILFAAQDVILHAFTTDPNVVGCISLVLPLVVLTQPVNAVAFVWDGVLYGVGGYATAVQATLVAALPAAGVMAVGSRLAVGGNAALQSIWVGLSVLMLLRALTVYILWIRRAGPFKQVQ